MSTKNKKKYSINLIFSESSLPRLETEVLLAFLLGKSREFILAHPEESLDKIVYKKFKELEKKRLNNWPIAYLIGNKEFYGLDFKINASVLTPRPETELIVDEIITLSGSGLYKEAQIIDIGTGSGAIIVAVAEELRRRFSLVFSQSAFKAVDISTRALIIAKKNAAKHKLKNKIKFYHGNLLEPLKLDITKLGHKKENKSKLSETSLIISANLPYLTKRQIKASPSISREPKLALDGGSDGLKYYRELFGQFTKLGLNTSKFCLLCEIDQSQRAKMTKLVKKYFPGAKLEIKKDLAGRYRLAKIFK